MSSSRAMKPDDWPFQPAGESSGMLAVDPANQLQLVKAILQGSDDAIFTKDLEGRYLSMNPAGARLLNRTVEEILGKTDLELMDSKEEAWATIARDRAVMRSGESVTYEAVDGPPGRERVWHTTKGCLRDPSGNVFGLFGIARDITERKRSEQQVSVNEERMRLCLEGAQLASWDWDLRTGRITWSSNSADVMGIPLAELNGDPKAFLGRIHPEDRDLMRQVVRDGQGQQGDQVIEFRLAEPAHSPPWFRGQGRTLWQDGNPVRTLGVVMDISAQKLAEEELRRNAIFQNQLIGIVSHDIRSPVTAIIGWATLLYDREDQETSESADSIIRSAERIERLTKRLLDLTEARLGRGIPVSFQRMNIHEVTERIVDESRAGHPTRLINLDQAGDGNGMWDPDRLGQIVSNLLENALKYSPPDSPVRISVHGDGRWVDLKVHNGGKPINPELLPHVFEPFRRGAPKAGGQRSLGLGLYIVRELVESHGGVIEVSSTQEGGTTFTVRLPQLDEGSVP
jgi:PAS domain S-box-containing protein